MGLGLALGLSLSTGRQGDGGSGLSAAFSTFASADYTPTADGVTTTALTFTAKDANDAAVEGASVTFSLLPRFSISASESGVGVSPSSIPDDGLTVAVVTATLEDANGNPLADTQTGGQVTCAVSGTGNTVTAQSTITDSLGRLYWNVVSTVAEAKTITITAYGLALSTTPTLTVSSGFVAPNLLSDLSFETTTDGMVDFGNPGMTRSNAQAYDGLWSMERTWTANAGDAGGWAAWEFGGGYDEVWVRFYLRLASGWDITSIHKFCLFWNTSYGTQFGGFNLGGPDATFGPSGLSWWSAQEHGSVQVPIIPLEDLTDDTWHCIEVHNRRNGDAFPSAAFWFDNAQVTRTDGPANGGWEWLNNRLVATERGSSAQLGVIRPGGIINGGNTGSGTYWIDLLAVSSNARIGP